MSRPSLIAFLGKLLSKTPPVRSDLATISRKEVRKRLVEALEPVLLADGFSRFKGASAWRHSAHWVDVVEIAFIKTYVTSGHSPSLHAGRYFTFVPQRDPESPVKQEGGRYWPIPELCHLRKTVFKPKPDSSTPANIWAIGPHGEGLDQCVAQALDVTETVLLPWYRWLDDLNAVLELVLSGKSDVEGKSRDPLLRGTWNYANYFGKHVVGGLIAVQLERWDLALELLEPVLQHGGTLGKDARVFPLPQAALDDIRRACGLARERAGR